MSWLSSEPTPHSNADKTRTHTRGQGQSQKLKAIHISTSGKDNNTTNGEIQTETN
jgi:hypothetical protein